MNLKRYTAIAPAGSVMIGAAVLAPWMLDGLPMLRGHSPQIVPAPDLTPSLLVRMDAVVRRRSAVEPTIDWSIIEPHRPADPPSRNPFEFPGDGPEVITCFPRSGW